MPRLPNPDILWRVWFIDMSVSPPRYHTFDNTLGAPADCQTYCDESVLCVWQKILGGRSTERVFGGARYVYLRAQQMWNRSSLDEIAAYPAAGIVIDANLNGWNFPEEIFQNALAFAETDDDFPHPVDVGSYGIADADRFNAALSLEGAVRLGRPAPQVE